MQGPRLTYLVSSENEGLKDGLKGSLEAVGSLQACVCSIAKEDGRHLPPAPYPLIKNLGGSHSPIVFP